MNYKQEAEELADYFGFTPLAEECREFQTGWRSEVIELIESALEKAHAAGRKEGLEEAAKIAFEFRKLCGSVTGPIYVDPIVDEIRLLIESGEIRKEEGK